MSKAKTQTTESGLKIKSRTAVQLPLFKFVLGKPLFLRFEGEFFTGKKVQEDREPATLANVTNLETGELGQIIVSAVTKGTLEDTYPNGDYVGKCFEITKHPKDGRGDKAYFPYSVFEIEV